MSKFFNKFPITGFRIDGTSDYAILTNFFRHVAKDDKRIQPLLQYEFYNINDGDRPDNVSFDLYGDESFHWTFFIINDHLKKGMSAWPKSYSEWTNWIEDQYNRYAVVTFLPELTTIPSSTIGGTTYLNLINNQNYVGGIDFENTDIRMIGINNSVSAKVLTYDMNTLQLWAYDFEGGDGNDFNANTSYRIENLEEEKTDWLLNMLEYFKKNKQTEYYQFLEAVNTNEIIPLSPEYFDYFYDNYVTALTFAPYENRSYFPSWEAPKKFFDAADQSDISHLDGLLLSSNNFQEYRDYEDEVRTENQQIKIIQPEYIYQFSREFKRLINS
jgi:hypothetical protein